MVCATYDATKTHRNTQSRLQCVLKYVPRPTQTDDLVWVLQHAKKLELTATKTAYRLAVDIRSELHVM